MTTSTTPARARELTDWFPADVKPVREGVYELDEPWFKDGVFAYWNGRRFGFRSFDIGFAHDRGINRAYTTLPCRARWRGLTQEAKC